MWKFVKLLEDRKPIGYKQIFRVKYSINRLMAYLKA